MAKVPKTCQGCRFAVKEEVAPGHSKPYCKERETWISLRDQACKLAEGKPRRKR